MRDLKGKAATETVHADLTFVADVTGKRHRLSLVITDGVEGWMCAVTYPDTKESITLAEYGRLDDAKRYAEGWARLVHRVTDQIEWLAGTPQPGT